MYDLYCTDTHSHTAFDLICFCFKTYALKPIWLLDISTLWHWSPVPAAISHLLFHLQWRVTFIMGLHVHHLQRSISVSHLFSQNCSPIEPWITAIWIIKMLNNYSMRVTNQIQPVQCMCKYTSTHVNVNTWGLCTWSKNSSMQRLLSCDISPKSPLSCDVIIPLVNMAWQW